MKKAIFSLIILAGPLAAEDMTDRQQAAFDAILPAMVAQMAELSPETDAGVMGAYMAECAATSAKRREAKALAAEDNEILSDDATEVVNKIMTRGKFAKCLTGKLSQ